MFARTRTMTFRRVFSPSPSPTHVLRARSASTSTTRDRSPGRCGPSQRAERPERLRHRPSREAPHDRRRARAARRAARHPPPPAASRSARSTRLCAKRAGTSYASRSTRCRTTHGAPARQPERHRYAIRAFDRGLSGTPRRAPERLQRGRPVHRRQVWAPSRRTSAEDLSRSRDDDGISRPFAAVRTAEGSREDHDDAIGRRPSNSNQRGAPQGATSQIDLAHGRTDRLHRGRRRKRDPVRGNDVGGLRPRASEGAALSVILAASLRRRNCVQVTPPRSSRSELAYRGLQVVRTSVGRLVCAGRRPAVASGRSSFFTAYA